MDALIIFGVLFSVLKHWICQQFTPFLTRLMVSSRSLRISNLIVNWNIKLWTGGKHPRTATAFFSCIFFSFHVVTQFVILKKKEKSIFAASFQNTGFEGLKLSRVEIPPRQGSAQLSKTSTLFFFFFFFFQSLYKAPAEGRERFMCRTQCGKAWAVFTNVCLLSGFGCGQFLN